MEEEIFSPALDTGIEDEGMRSRMRRGRERAGSERCMGRVNDMILLDTFDTLALSIRI
jgi:hypothetical protein